MGPSLLAFAFVIYKEAFEQILDPRQFPPNPEQRSPGPAAASLTSTHPGCHTRCAGK